ncbi:MAG: ABC1 kinase family protein [Ignavibacteriales bacterium]
MGIKLSIRHMKRYHEIADVFGRHGFGFVMTRLGFGKLVPKGYASRLDNFDSETDLAQRFGRALMDLGPTFVKLGQLLSTRPDLLPPPFIVELEQLQDKVKPVPFDKIHEMLLEEIGDPDELFLEFDKTPLAAASIGQVHSALLKTGEKVIVKVQRPGIVDQIDNDLDIMVGLASFAEKRSSEARQIGLLGIVEDYAKTLRKELDYDREAKNTERIRKNFATDSHVIIPRVYWDYSSPKVITEEYIEGIKFNDLQAIEARGWDRKKLSKLGTESFLTQIMIHGFFQADPHPGNMLIINEDQMSFIDFGETGSLRGARLYNLGTLFTCVGKREIYGIMASLQDMGIVQEGMDTEELMDEIDELIEQVYSSNLGKINMSQVRKDILDLAFRYQLRLPAYMTSLMKALIIVEGVGKKLDRSFNIADVVQPLSEKMIKEKLKPEGLMEFARRSYFKDIRPILSFPTNMNNLVRGTEKGRLTVNIRLSFTSEAQSKMSQMISRLGTSLIIAGGFVGSALIITAGHDSIPSEFTPLGAIGFGVALIGLVAFIVSAFKPRK